MVNTPKDYIKQQTGTFLNQKSGNTRAATCCTRAQTPHVEGFELIQLCCSHAELGGECLPFQYEEEDDCAPELSSIQLAGPIAADQVSLFAHSGGIQRLTLKISPRSPAPEDPRLLKLYFNICI